MSSRGFLLVAIEVTRDLSRAVVTYLPLGGPPSPDLIDGLEQAAHEMREPIGEALRLRYTPELVFEVGTHDEASRVTALLEHPGGELPSTEEPE